MARIRLITDLNDGKEVDLAIEAVYEKLELKQDVFQKLDKNCPPRYVDCQQYVRDTDHRACCRNQPSG